MKRFFFFIISLLLSASAFAQSESTPLKGDVNDDGTVDVADMVGIIKIMKDAGGAIGEKQAYWYAGTNGGNAVTADNFTDVATKIAESEIPQTGTVTASGQYVYIVLPETRHLESLTDGGGSAVEITCTDVMGYHIYKTNDKINGSINYSVVQTVYYWYAGQTPPTSISGTPTVDDTNFTNNKWHTIGTTLTNIGKLVTGGTAGNEWYVAVPKDKYQPTASDLSTPDNAWIIIDTITIGSIQYSVYDPGVDSNRCATYLKVK